MTFQLIENSLTMTPASFLNSLGCIQSGPVDLYTLSWVKYSLKWFYSTDFLLMLRFHKLLVGLGMWEAWGWTSPVKTKVSKALNTSAFSMSHVTSSPSPQSSGLTLAFDVSALLEASPVAGQITSNFHHQSRFNFLVSLSPCSAKPLTGSLRNFNYTVSQSLQPRLPSMSSTSSYWFVSSRFSRVSYSAPWSLASRSCLQRTPEVDCTACVSYECHYPPLIGSTPVA